MNERLLICTDLDRTLIPNGTQPESPGARRLFSALVSRPEVTLAYVTGRHRSLVQKAIANYVLPTPDFVIGDVGTTIYKVGPPESWVPDSEWEEVIGQDWRGFSREQVKSLFNGIRELRLQEISKQNRFKLSYYVSLHADTVGLIGIMREKLNDRKLDANLIWSVDEPAGLGLLDVLPARASKFHALEFLMHSLGMDETETVFSGDSGNDLEVLVSHIPSVLVANSPHEVKNQARRGVQARGNERSLYIAQGGFMGMNGNYGAGIMEGIAHFHPVVQKWLGGGE